MGDLAEEENQFPDLSMAERERPTLKTIARLTGFSVPTVSRALSDAPDIRAKTKTRVQEIARELGYRRDRAAVRLRTGKTNVIALAIRTDHEVMNTSAKLIGSIAGAFRDTSYHLVVIPYFGDEDPIEPVKYIVRTGSADGVILNRIKPNDSRVSYLLEHNFPFALHGRLHQTAGIPYCDFDNETFGCKAIEALHARGRRTYLMVAPPQDQNYSMLMINGAEAACTRLGCRLHVLEDATSDDPSAKVVEAVSQTLAGHPEIDGIVTASVPSSMAATIAVENSGRRLGLDVDLASKEAVPFLKAFRKEILVTSEDIGETGRFLAKALIAAIENPAAAPRQKLLQPLPFET